MRQVVTAPALVSTVLAALTSKFMVLVFLVALQTQVISSTSVEVTFVDKWGSDGSGDGKFQSLWDVSVLDRGRGYLADSDNHRIQGVDAGGTNKISVYQFQAASEAPKRQTGHRSSIGNKGGCNVMR